MELKEKEAFFALYWGQKILIMPNYNMLQTIFVHHVNLSRIEDCVLELKSLEDITDEDAIEVAIMFNRYRLGSNRYFDQWKVKKIHNGNIKVVLSNDFYDLEVMISISGSVWSNDDSIPNNYKITSNFVDFLRSNGYALDWTNSEGRTYTVAELVAEGVVKLKGR